MVACGSDYDDVLEEPDDDVVDDDECVALGSVCCCGSEDVPDEDVSYEPDNVEVFLAGLLASGLGFARVLEGCKDLGSDSVELGSGIPDSIPVYTKIKLS